MTQYSHKLWMACRALFALQDMNCFLTSTNYDPTVEEDALRALLAPPSDGIVLTSTSHSSGVKNLLKSVNIPVVEIWQLPSQPLDIAVGFRIFKRDMTWRIT